jgi:hypothetical protein
VTIGQRTDHGKAAADAPLVEVAGDVDPAVLAALAAAVDAVWPRPPLQVEPDLGGIQRWRFSGRWWSRPATTRRDRPRT